MARKYEEFEEAEKGELKAEFTNQNPDYWEALQGRPEDIARAREILAHTKETVKELEADYRETKEQRLARQELKVFEERAKQTFVLGTPIDEDRLSRSSVAREARKREVLALKGRVNAVERNGEQAIREIVHKNCNPNSQAKERSVETMSAQERVTHFKGKIHEAIENANKARAQARRLYAQNREELIDKARTDWSDNPERDVALAQREILQAVDKQLHVDIHGVFEEAGWDRDHQDVEFAAHQQTKEDISHLVDKLEEVTARQKNADATEPSHAADQDRETLAPEQSSEAEHAQDADVDRSDDHDEGHSHDR